ncbi:MAG: LacI family transcriptional regulator [Oligosphaeraceae bacterium]|nr:LacI family transcriptional regulator [Oligosphaeraceae bacterium]
MTDKRVTLSTIASLTGVNASTVSRALNPRTSHLVEGRLCARILSVCDELGYRPGLLGRSFATGRTYKIGFISGHLQGDLSSPLLAQLLAGLTERLQAQNYSLTLLPYSAGQGRDSLRQLLMSDVADAYLLGVSMLDEQTREILLNSRRLVLTLGTHNLREQDAFSSLILDDLPAYQQVWRMLPRSWWQRVLFVGEACVSTEYKLATMRRAAGVCNLNGSEIPARILPSPCVHFTLNRHRAMLYGEEHWRELAQYRLLWCASDLTALGLADALTRRGLRLGEDFCLLGQDNLESLYGLNYQPLLTSVDPQMYEAGVQTAELLLQQLNTDQAANRLQKIKLPSRLIFRQSLPEHLNPEM